MSYLNSSIPEFKAFVRAEFLHNLEEKHGELVRAIVFGVRSDTSRALGWRVLLEDGAQFAEIPAHAIVFKEDAEQLPLEVCEMWDCFGREFTVTRYDLLKNMSADLFMQDKQWRTGIYLFSLDWAENGWSEMPEERKDGHVFKLDSGNLAIYPNNRIRWRELSFVKKPFDKPTYKANTYFWHAEDENFEGPISLRKDDQ